MLDVYYDKEAPFPPELAKVCAMIGARTDEEREIVAELLLVKFTLSDAGYSHERCDTEIAAYRVKAEAAQINGKKGGRPPKNNPAKPSGFPLGSDPVSGINPDLTGSKANQEPITKNQEPKEETQPATEHAATARCVRSVDLSIAFRASGILTQPANPVLIELAEQGVQVETVNAACEAAKAAKPGEQVSLGYVVAILKRWAKEAAQTKVAGAAQPRASPGRPVSRQSGFEQLDYNEGIEDGRIT